MLSYRLKRIAESINKCGYLADIGTDHAYIPIYAVRNGIAERAVAADISEGSCNKARLNVKAHGLADKIDVRQGDGLDAIKENEKPDTIIIAGMGGLLMIGILKKGIDTALQASQLLLQPQRDIEEVRRFVHSIGFKISNESIFKDGGKFYTLMDCERGKEDYTKLEYKFGRIPLNDGSPVLKEYINSKNNKLLKVLENMSSNGRTDDEAYKRLYAEAKMCEEAMKCL